MCLSVLHTGSRTIDGPTVIGEKPTATTIIHQMSQQRISSHILPLTPQRPSRIRSSIDGFRTMDSCQGPVAWSSMINTVFWTTCTGFISKVTITILTLCVCRLIGLSVEVGLFCSYLVEEQRKDTENCLKDFCVYIFGHSYPEFISGQAFGCVDPLEGQIVSLQ